MPVDPSQASFVFAAIEKKYGVGSIHSGIDAPPIARISTGSHELDHATGGGIPMGRWTHLWGGISSGKSLTGWNVTRNAMKMGLGVCYYNIEKQFDPDFVSKQGIDLSSDRFRVVEEVKIESIGDMMESLLSTYHVHIVDSLANAISVDALNAKVEEWQRGLSARAWGKVLIRVHDKLAVDNAVIMINQARDSFGQTGGEHSPGGRFIDFVSSMTVYFKRATWLYRTADGRLDPEAPMQKGASEMAEPEGIEMIARVVKSRVCRPLRTARMRYDFASGGWDLTWELVKAAKFHGLINGGGRGGWYTAPDGERLHGEPSLREYIGLHPEFAEQVREKLRAA